MGMDHKAYIFDTKKYHVDIEMILDMCCYEKSVTKAEIYINEHWKELTSPYTGERLNKEWKKSLYSGSLQEHFDILLTACYDCEKDIGLDYRWDGVTEVLKQLNFMDNIVVCVLGKRIIYHDTIVDPGAMGLGIVEAEDVGFIYKKLEQNEFLLDEMKLPQDMLYKMDEEEIKEAYDDLIGIYRVAKKEAKGIMFTF